MRATYLYSALADLAAEMSDDGLAQVCNGLFESIRLSRMYITGGIGSAAQGERFTSDYDLPSETAYAETCAAIGLVFFAHRMLQVSCDSRFSDVVERALYNAVASGMSLDGRRFFYDSPLASHGQHTRQDWFQCACCPTNVARVLPTVGGYYYSTNGESIAVHLYGRTALSRGPIVYCIEGIDQEHSVDRIRLRPKDSFSAVFARQLLGGVVALDGSAGLEDEGAWSGVLYRRTETVPGLVGDTSVRAVPYAVWANRGPSGMAVWIPRKEG